MGGGAMALSEEVMAQWLLALHGILSVDGCTTYEASEITPSLFVGGKPAAEDAMSTNKLGITHVLNCCEPWCASGPNWSSLSYLGFEAYDEAEYPLLVTHYPKVKEFMATVGANDRVLVHCAMGINRSAAICAAHLIEACGMCLLEACALVKDKRG